MKLFESLIATLKKIANNTETIENFISLVLKSIKLARELVVIFAKT